MSMVNIEPTELAQHSLCKDTFTNDLQNPQYSHSVFGNALSVLAWKGEFSLAFPNYCLHSHQSQQKFVNVLQEQCHNCKLYAVLI